MEQCGGFRMRFVCVEEWDTDERGGFRDSCYLWVVEWH